MDKPLSRQDREDFKKHDAIVEEGLLYAFAAGNSLGIIRDGRLYRENYTTFEDYCSQRRDISRRRAYQLIDASIIRGQLEDQGVKVLPQNERQARELKRLPTPEKRAEAWDDAVDTFPAGDKPPPQSAVKRAVESRLPKPKTKPTAEVEPELDHIQCPVCESVFKMHDSYRRIGEEKDQPVRPKQAQQRSVQRDLEAYFSKLSNIPMPTPTNERDRKAAAVRWWQPLKEIAELAHWNEREGENLIADAFKHLRSNGILLEAPQSIIKTARALAAGQTPGKQSGLDILKQDFQQNEAEMEEARHES